jgi:hypothetical protein
MSHSPSEINTMLYPHWVSMSLKKHHNLSSEDCVAHPVGYNSPVQILMAVYHTFLKFELARLGVGACCRL